jgi:hypothetical protein
MKLHEIENLGDAPFRRMKVESGFMYNAWDDDRQDWEVGWTFVPESSERAKKLEHHHATTVGLWATDRPDLIDDPKKLLFEIT